MRINFDDLKIRKAVLADVFVLAEHRNMFLEELFKYSYQDLRHIEYNNQEYMREKISDGSYLAYIAEYNGHTVASAGMLLKEYPQKNIEKKRIVATVLSVFTHPEYRNNRIATILINEMVNEARILGIKKMELLATKKGEAVYKKIGFSEPAEKYMELELQ